MRRYIAFLEQDGSSACTITFPDFPGCATSAHCLNGAVSLSAAVLQQHIESMLLDGEEIPEPSSFETITKEHRDRIFILVPARPA
jgi:predicted RNase H-like HicB family nuclease